MSSRRHGALCLAVLAAVGLVVAPALHELQHAREAEADRELTLLVQRLSLHGADFDDVFAEVWKLARDGKRPAHSHGEGPRGQHGSGSVLHHALALHAAPALPATTLLLARLEQVSPPPPDRAPAQAWRTPELSQAPPFAS
ncbi:MAG TPA: hypothetical protein VH083_17585 [Myxococcales bacterium]|nr:hypothetical protein [Myxococcales bacterium]